MPLLQAEHIRSAVTKSPYIHICLQREEAGAGTGKAEAPGRAGGQVQRPGGSWQQAGIGPKGLAEPGAGYAGEGAGCGDADGCSRQI